MIRKSANQWQKKGSRSAVFAREPEVFVAQHVSPLFFLRTSSAQKVRDHRDIFSEEQFWDEGGDIMLGAVSLNGFRLTDWFPRAPGVYWSRYARKAREQVWSAQSLTDAELGEYFSPESKR